MKTFLIDWLVGSLLLSVILFAAIQVYRGDVSLAALTLYALSVGLLYGDYRAPRFFKAIGRGR